MKYKIEIPEFEDRDIILHVNLFGRKKISVDGIFLQPINGQFIIKKKNGQNVPIRLRRRFYDVFPHVEVGMYRIDVVPPMKWYEYFGVVIPVSLYFVSHLIGGILGAVGIYILTRVFRTSLSTGVKYCISIGYTLVASILMIIGFFFAGFLRDELIALAYKSRIDAPVEDVHHGKHSTKLSVVLYKNMPVDRYGYPDVHLDVLWLRKLLKEGRYKELNDTLQFFQQLFERDFRYEGLLAEAYYAFNVSDLSLEQPLNLWVDISPAQYQPYIARSMFKMSLGWDSRGTRWASETPAESFMLMERYFFAAKEDAFTALTINPRTTIPYEILLSITRANGESKASEYIVEKGLEACPYLYRLRERYMMQLLPRWGGSYNEMDFFAEEAQQYKNINPKLSVLRGFSLWDYGRVLESDSNWTEALSYYNSALQYGESISFLKERGEYNYRIDNYNAALADLNRAVSMSPQDPDLLLLKSKVLFYLENFDVSSHLLDTVSLIDPYMKKDILKWKDNAAHHLVVEGYRYYKLEQYDKAIERYNNAIGYNNTYADAFYYRGVIFSRLQRVNEAIEDLQTAIKYKPNDIDIYIYLDWCYAQLQNWDTIIQMWDKFIELEPENARAYRERGGASFHKGDKESAKKDMQKACELKDEEACSVLAKLNNGNL